MSNWKDVCGIKACRIRNSFQWFHLLIRLAVGTSCKWLWLFFFFAFLDFKNEVNITCLQTSWNSRIKKPIKHLRRSVCVVFKSSLRVVCRSIHTIARQLHSLVSIKRRWMTFFMDSHPYNIFVFGIIIITCMQSACVLGTRPWASIRFSFISILK